MKENELFKTNVASVHDTEANRGEEVQFHPFLISALDSGKWLALRPGHF